MAALSSLELISFIAYKTLDEISTLEINGQVEEQKPKTQAMKRKVNERVSSNFLDNLNCNFIV